MTTTITIADTAINTTYQDKTGTTSGAGTGAKFDVTKTNGVYTVALDSLVASAGSGYVAGDTITILGSAIGGVDTTNDLILTVATVGAGGKVATFGSVGTGRAGDGTVDINIDVTGTVGTDTFAIAGDSTDFTVTKTDDDITVDSLLATNATFELADHERVVFDDTAFAFDTEGNAGEVYTLLAAGLGLADVTPELAGIGIHFADLGLTTVQLAQALADSAIFQEDAGGTSNETFVRNVYTNVIGSAPTLAEVTEYTGLLNSGAYTKGQLLVLASEVEDFVTSVDLTGLATTGIEYTVM
jgi:serralysin